MTSERRRRLLENNVANYEQWMILEVAAADDNHRMKDNKLLIKA